MNKILYEIQLKIQKTLKEYLPEVSVEDLEEAGKIYYMNGKNGTEFDWFVNEHFSNFMVFYNDESNMGAIKATVYTDGVMVIYVYGDHGKELINKVDTCLDVEDSELLALAVNMRMNFDDKKVFDASIDKIDVDLIPNQKNIEEFLEHKSFYEPSIIRRDLMDKLCVVSKKVTRDGWKVGYMLRDNLRDEQDSGWQFFAGDESDEYINDVNNVELCIVGSIIGIDPILMNYIDSPVGTSFVRISSSEFEAENNQTSYMEKWK